MNKAILIGNLTRDPELKTTPNGISVCTFTVAVQRTFSKDAERQTDFIPIVTWRGLAENCGKYLAKGRPVAVSGSIRTRSYDGKDGTKRYVTEVVADDVQFLGGGKSSGDTQSVAQDASAPYDDMGGGDFTPMDDEELPF